MEEQSTYDGEGHSVPLLQEQALSTMAELLNHITTTRVEEAITSVYQIIQNMEDMLQEYRVNLLYMEWSTKETVTVLTLHLFMMTMSHVLSAMSPPGQLY